MNSDFITRVFSDFHSNPSFWFKIFVVVLVISVIGFGVTHSKVSLMEVSYYQQRFLNFYRILEGALIIVILLSIFGAFTTGFLSSM